MITIRGKYNSADIFADDYSPETISSLMNFLNSELFADTKIAMMPDIHYSKGAIVGTTIRKESEWDKFVPDVIGTDIGCGVIAAKLNINDFDHQDFIKLESVITKFIPSGAEIHNSIQNSDQAKSILRGVRATLNESDILRSLCTLGGGNHFIELDKSYLGEFYLLIHTGSRFLGVDVNNYYNKFSKSDSTGQFKYIEGDHLKDYFNDVFQSQLFARLNRKLILEKICKEMGWEFSKIIESEHNYIDFETNTIRKGSISAKFGEEMIIPINMKFGSLICSGKGLLDWNESGPHGAGRLFSRSDAKEFIDIHYFEDDMDGVFTNSARADLISESPEAYRDPEIILDAIADSVEIISHIQSVYNFKSAIKEKG